MTCQPSGLQSGYPIIYLQRGTRTKGEKKSDTNQITASIGSEESQRGLIKAGLAQELSVRSVGQKSPFSLMPSPGTDHQSSKFMVEPIRLEVWFRLSRFIPGSDQTVVNKGPGK